MRRREEGVYGNIMNTAALRELQQIPGVGKSIAADLYGLGIHSVKGLRRKSPEGLYLKLCAKQGVHIDRCVLYVFRSAVYFASHKKHNPELLKWWNWKDKKFQPAKNPNPCFPPPPVPGAPSNPNFSFTTYTFRYIVKYTLGPKTLKSRLCGVFYFL